jgi:hypothetical protein
MKFLRIFLQGRVKLPTGGDSPRLPLKGLNWWNSGTDSKVWMIEEVNGFRTIKKSHNNALSDIVLYRSGFLFF